ncbi:MAG: hypothetical protein N2109_10185 [Fimbriimonadales bacterium]|nr:hypothetical protein [Fimbriimonadales bacterium]
MSKRISLAVLVTFALVATTFAQGPGTRICDGTGKSDGQRLLAGQANGSGNGQRIRERKRDGSCGGAQNQNRQRQGNGGGKRQGGR